MDVGVGLDARLGLAPEELRELGVEGARLGFTSLWTPAGGGVDAFHVCARWADATAAAGGLRPTVATGVVPSPRWTLPTLAAQAGTVGLLSGGRFTLGIGTGGWGPGFFESLGLPPRPLAVMRDHLVVLRRLLAGETVTYEGAALSVTGASMGLPAQPVPLYLGALGPGMVRLAGELADGVSLNWATPAQIAWSRERVAEGAARAGRDPAEVRLAMYIRVCVDEDVDGARLALARQVLGYALGRRGVPNTLGYRGHFGRMGFEEVLTDLEARRDAGEDLDALAAAVPDEVLLAVGYFGPPEGAAEAYRKLSVGLDETIVRVVTIRPSVEAVRVAMEALRPQVLV